jgi:hypothetical protein
MFPFELKKGLFTRGEAGLCCDEDGVALGLVRLVEKCDAVPGKRYRICSPEVFVKAFVTAYGKPPLDVALHFYEGLGRVMKSLDKGDLTLAMMKAIFLGFPEIEPEGMAKLAMCELGKSNLDHDAGNGRVTGLSRTVKSAPVASAEAAQQARAFKLALSRAREVAKYNHNHDPENGRFASAPGGASNNMEEMVVTAHRIHGVDRKQLIAWEGGQKTKGYILRDKNGNIIGNSGVTVGTGVDLGHHSGDELLKAGVSPALVEKLSPYLGPKKEDAQTMLGEKGPLTLTQAEADELDNAFYQKHLNEVRTKYNADVDAANAADNESGKVPETERAYLDDLPSAMQTTVVSTTYNMAANYGSSTQNDLKQNLWRDLVDNNSIGAESSLRSLGSPADNPYEYPAIRNRRIKEANYLSGYNRNKSKPE